ncbi:MAG: hypothetical protein WCC26_02570 [Terracidiphilus sp.]
MRESVHIGELRDGDLHLVLADIADHIHHKVPTFFFCMISLPTGVDMGQINLRVGSVPHLER